MLLPGLVLVFNFMGDHRMSFGKYAVALLVASTAIACQRNDADRNPENRVEPVVTNDTDDNDNDNDDDNADNDNNAATRAFFRLPAIRSRRAAKMGRDVGL